MSARKVLGIDMGASNGRAVIGSCDGRRLVLEELHRFANNPVLLNSGFYWDILGLFQEIKTSLGKTAGARIDSIGVDTWGVDFGLLDENGYLLENPHHYRDPRTESIPHEVYEKLPEYEIFTRTGMNPLHITSLFQLVAQWHNQPNLVKVARNILFIPDLFRFLLTGDISSEYTIAATSLLFDPNSRQWINRFLDAYGIPDILPPLESSGELAGKLTASIADELGVGRIPVTRIAGHDTASAILAVPSSKEEAAYISCGTWSVVGADEDRFLTDKEVLAKGFNNEMGYGETNMFVKNITGLWVLQECIREWQMEGYKVDYAELDKSIHNVKSSPFIRLDSEAFMEPGNMPHKVKAFTEETNQQAPVSKEEVYKTVWLSLALKNRQTLDELAALTGRKYEVIHLIGGGARSDYLCQTIADLSHTPVVSGPCEATVIGNILVQLIALGELKDAQEAKQLVRDSFPIKTFDPQPSDQLEELYNTYLMP